MRLAELEQFPVEFAQTVSGFRDRHVISQREHRAEARELAENHEKVAEELTAASQARVDGLGVVFERERDSLQAGGQSCYDLAHRLRNAAGAKIDEHAAGCESRARLAQKQGLQQAKVSSEQSIADAHAEQERLNTNLSTFDEPFVDLDQRVKPFLHLLKSTLNADSEADDSLDICTQEDIDALEEARESVDEALTGLTNLPLPRFFSRVRAGVLYSLLVLIFGGIFALGFKLDALVPTLKFGIPFLALLLGLVGLLSFIAKRQSRIRTAQIWLDVQMLRDRQAELQHANGLQLQNRLTHAASTRQQAETAAMEACRISINETKRKQAEATAATNKAGEAAALHIETAHRDAMRDFNAVFDAEFANVERELSEKGETVAAEHAAALDEITARHQQEDDTLASDWKTAIAAYFAAAKAIRKTALEAFPQWDDSAWTDWQAPDKFNDVVRIGELTLDMKTRIERWPPADRFPLPDAPSFTLPLLLDFPLSASMLIEASASTRGVAIDTLGNSMMRLLTTVPPGQARFTLLDPVGLGESFAGFMHLADYDENLVGARIWSDARHIEQRLADLSEHMEKVIQKYLRNEFENIAEYNAHAGEMAEPYRFLVIADFPVGFSESSCRRLISIINSGRRCGVYTFLHRDMRHDLPPGVKPSELRSISTYFAASKKSFRWEGGSFADCGLTLEAQPPSTMTNDLLHQVGTAAGEASRVEVPFASVTPNGELWTESTVPVLRVPLGKAGAGKLQYLELGRGTSQHALVAGKTGSGKSTLFHVLITNLALWHSPDEVEFYLIDFKKGVEFKPYATHALPHARAIAIESDREFGLSVLRRVDEELRERGEAFRAAHVQDLAGFRKASDRKMPRTLILIDEFQEFFVQDDRIGQEASLLLDRIVRQGRAFGIHIILGSQTLGGAYSLARSTMGQMTVRVALQCSEADSYLILDESNSAARLLMRPGEAIYNDTAGMIEGNNPFQVTWLADHEHLGALKQVAEFAKAQGYTPPSPPIIYEGNAPALLELNPEVASLLAADSPPTVSVPVAWLGSPNAIRPPVRAEFAAQSGANLLIVGQQPDKVLALMTAMMAGLRLQLPGEESRVIILNGLHATTPDSQVIEAYGESVAHHELGTALQALGVEVTKRHESGGVRPAIFLFVYGLNRFRKLRQEEDFSFSVDDKPKPEKDFADIMRDGPEVGVHVIAWCDTMNNLNRSLNRRALREFELRVLFQMSANDSISLIDSPDASRLGMHRAIFANEQESATETFRPYAQPTTAPFAPSC
ncbi:MAG: S-DNA-T family DNA segregation ATPase FtsK/SpoIIIE [Rhodothermales bacterium]|jgi:S-DNA-T family DNA segregation ATPase FtsK/SpoIIIE